MVPEAVKYKQREIAGVHCCAGFKFVFGGCMGPNDCLCDCDLCTGRSKMVVFEREDKTTTPVSLQECFTHMSNEEKRAFLYRMAQLLDDLARASDPCDDDSV